MIKKYFKIWWLYAGNSFQSQFAVRWAFIIFLIAKILRFATFTLFIVLIFQRTKALAGYNLDQVMLFFLSFNLVEVIGQLIFREVYRFRPQIVSGNFDFYLIKPVNPLFRSLLGGPDILDFFTLIPLFTVTAFYLNRIGADPFSLGLYVLLILIGLLITTAFHILVLSLAIVTTEIDHAIMLYRDIVGLGRMPIDIYKEPLRGILTFVVPVGIMISFPVKALLGVLSPLLVIYALVFAALLFFISLRVWDYAVNRYSSASS